MMDRLNLGIEGERAVLPPGELRFSSNCTKAPALTRSIDEQAHTHTLAPTDARTLIGSGLIKWKTKGQTLEE